MCHPLHQKTAVDREWLSFFSVPSFFSVFVFSFPIVWKLLFDIFSEALNKRLKVCCELRHELFV